MLTFEKQLIVNGNVGSFYRYANCKLRSRSAVGPLSDDRVALVADSLGKASLLQHTFFKIFTVDNGILPTISVVLVTLKSNILLLLVTLKSNALLLLQYVSVTHIETEYQQFVGLAI
jgi:hypothetical protein